MVITLDRRNNPLNPYIRFLLTAIAILLPIPTTTGVYSDDSVENREARNGLTTTQESEKGETVVIVLGGDEGSGCEKAKTEKKPLSLIPLTTPIPSLTVSDTILGILPFFSKKRQNTNQISRPWIQRHNCLQRLISRPSRSRQTRPPRFRIPRHS